MNDEEKKRFELYFPMYYPSVRNNHNSSATEGTSRFRSACKLSVREYRELEVLETKFERENYEVPEVDYDERYCDFERVNHRNHNSSWTNPVDFSWKPEYNYHAPPHMNFEQNFPNFPHEPPYNVCTNTNSLEDTLHTFIEEQREFNKQFVEDFRETSTQLSELTNAIISHNLSQFSSQPEAITPSPTPSSKPIEDDAITIWSETLSHT